MPQAKVARPPRLRASRNPELRGCIRRKWTEHYGAGHLRGQRCEDVSSENGLNTSAQGIPEPRGARMLQAKVARPPWGRAPPRSHLRGCRRRKWPEHVCSGRLGTLSCEDVSGESGQTTMGQGNSEVRLARMSQAKVPGPPWGREPPRSEL